MSRMFSSDVRLPGFNLRVVFLTEYFRVFLRPPNECSNNVYKLYPLFIIIFLSNILTSVTNVADTNDGEDVDGLLRNVGVCIEKSTRHYDGEY